MDSHFEDPFRPNYEWEALAEILNVSDKVCTEFISAVSNIPLDLDNFKKFETILALSEEYSIKQGDEIPKGYLSHIDLCIGFCPELIVLDMLTLVTHDIQDLMECEGSGMMVDIRAEKLKINILLTERLNIDINLDRMLFRSTVELMNSTCTYPGEEMVITILKMQAIIDAIIEDYGENDYLKNEVEKYFEINKSKGLIREDRFPDYQLAINDIARLLLNEFDNRVTYELTLNYFYGCFENFRMYPDEMNSLCKALNLHSFPTKNDLALANRQKISEMAQIIRRIFNIVE